MWGRISAIGGAGLNLLNEKVNSVKTELASGTKVGEIVSFVKKSLEHEAVDLEEIGLYYITDRVIIMGYPSDEMTHTGRPIELYSKHLRSRHAGQFMIYNMSEKVYDYAKFDNQIIEFKYPGYPAPPLDRIFGICNSIHSWLSAAPANVAVLHCQTGNGRSVTVAAAYLAWSKSIETPTPLQALNLIAEKRHTRPDLLIIPTQSRYLSYVSWVLEGRLPSTKPITLERVIMHGIPAIEGGRVRPYLQIFKSAKLVYSTYGRDDDQIRWYDSTDSSILFPVAISVEADVLVRIRHINLKGKRESILRFGFHTGYIRPGNSRFVKKQMDGACNDKRFADDFFLDLIFRTSVDETGREVTGAVDDTYWDQVAKQKEDTFDRNACFSVGSDDAGGMDDEDEEGPMHSSFDSSSSSSSSSTSSQSVPSFNSSSSFIGETKESAPAAPPVSEISDPSTFTLESDEDENATTFIHVASNPDAAPSSDSPALSSDSPALSSDSPAPFSTISLTEDTNSSASVAPASDYGGSSRSVAINDAATPHPIVESAEEKEAQGTMNEVTAPVLPEHNRDIIPEAASTHVEISTNPSQSDAGVPVAEAKTNTTHEKQTSEEHVDAEQGIKNEDEEFLADLLNDLDVPTDTQGNAALEHLLAGDEPDDDAEDFLNSLKSLDD